MIPGRAEGMLGHQPALRENHEVDIRGAFLAGRRRQHREDRRIGMIEQDRADRRKCPEIIFVGRVIAVPGDHVERRMADLGFMERAAPFDEQRVQGVSFSSYAGDRRLEVARIGEAVGADRPAIRHGELGAIVFADIAARRPIEAARP